MRERERHAYTAATEVVSVASPLFSRDAAKCCRSVAAPRVRLLGARAREIQISLIRQQPEKSFHHYLEISYFYKLFINFLNIFDGDNFLLGHNYFIFIHMSGAYLKNHGV